MNILIENQKLPSTRYRGSKRKLAGWIHSHLSKIPFHTVLDGFGGSGSVSYLFKLMNKEVTYNDYLKFNYYIGKAIIENNLVLLSQKDIAYFLDHAFTNRSHKIVEAKYQDIYYTEDENKWIDKFINRIDNFENFGTEYSKVEIDFKKSMALYSLFQACLVKRPFNLFHRSNLQIRLKEVKRKFGNKVTWETPFQAHFESFATEVNGYVFDSGVPCKATNFNIFDVDDYGYDLVYLDPPYYSRERSNESSDYFNCYHFLEGLSRYREWEKLIDYSSKNLRLKPEDNANPMSDKNIKENMENLINKFRKSSIVISYKKYGIPSIETLIKMLRKHNKRVYTVTKHYSYALNHQNGDAKKNREVLLIGLNKR